MRIGLVSEPGGKDVLKQALVLTPEHHVVWTAETGADAVGLCASDTPDLVVMDLSLSGMDGVDVTRRIMLQTPCAILLVAGSVRSSTACVFEAMGHGALDAVDMPIHGGDLRAGAVPFLAKLATISRLIGDKPRVGTVPVLSESAVSREHDTLVAIGASAGGPAALAVILGKLPKDFPAAVVIVQHVDAHFAAGMADWLGQHSAMPVAVASEGHVVTAGRVLIAGTSDHLALKTARRLGYTPEPRQYAYRPSVDVFFQSVGRLWRGEAIGVLLTGMGSDGALGLKTLRAHGHHTIAQDAASSAVYGMPKAAANLCAAAEILPVERVASRLLALVRATARVPAR